MKKSLILGLVLFASIKCYASEVDSFTGHPENLKDSSYVLNKKVNDSLYSVVERLNSNHIACPEKGIYPKKLYHYVEDNLVGAGGHLFYANIERFVENSPLLESISISRRKSIYQDFSIFEFPVFIAARLATAIKFGNYVIGSDKIGHFAAIGQEYFTKSVLQGKGRSAAIRHGHNQEKGIMGYKSTGVYSYGDLVANYEGLRFWNDLYDFGQKKISSKGNQKRRSYFSCQKGKWELSQEVDLGHYIHAGWDERLNCNKYKNRKTAGYVERRTRRFIKNFKAEQCPLAMSLIDKNVLTDRYDRTELEHLFHPSIKWP